MPRTPLGAVAIVIGAILLLLGALLSDASRLLEPDAFADRVAASLEDERVAAFVAERITDAVLAQQRDLTAFRPLIVAGARDVVGSDAFRGVARTAAREVHGAFFSKTGRSVILSVPDLEIVLRSALAGSPAIAEAIPHDVAVSVTDLPKHPALRIAVAVVRVGVAISGYAWLALILGALFMTGGVFVMPDRRDALVGAGAALIVTGVGLWATGPVGTSIIAGLVEDQRTAGALSGLWTVALAGVPWWGLMYGGIGVVLAAAGSSLLERLDVSELGEHARDILIKPYQRPRTRLLRGVLVAATGTALVFAPRAVLAVVTVLAGLLVLFIGLREIFGVVLQSRPAHQHFGKAFSDSGEGWAVGGALVLLLAAVFATAITLFHRVSAERRIPTTIDACNGAPVLCNRRLDQVVFAGTHNAMSAVEYPNWLFPQQERGLVGQLNDGIRALLFDVHYGNPVGDRVRTDFSGGRSADAERMLGPEGVSAAMRIRNRLVEGEVGPRGLYLCHGFCELGALPIDTALQQIHRFLVQHANDVIILVIEDHVAVKDLKDAFERNGLDHLAFRGDVAKPWPTLRELIAEDQRLVAFIESGREGADFLLPAFAVFQETPYVFRQAGDTLSCAPNRGGTVGSLFQINHWIETTPTPRPSNAEIVNRLDVLLERATRCQRVRGRVPNIIAVDFYRTGDVVKAARILNGIEPIPANFAEKR